MQKNKYKLSKYNRAVLAHDTYDHIDDAVSVTSLLKSTRAIILAKWDKNRSGDVSDNIAMVLGTAMHDYRQSVPYPLAIQREIRMFTDLKKFGVTDFILSGKPDSVDFDFNLPVIDTDDGLVVIEDLKVSSVYKLKSEEYSEYALQLSMLKYLALKDKDMKVLLKKKGIEQKEASFSNTGVITFLAKDWNARSSGLTPIAMKELPIKLLNTKSTEDFIRARVTEVNEYWNVQDQDELLGCSEDYKKKYGGKNCSKFCSVKYICRHSTYEEGL